MSICHEKRRVCHDVTNSGDVTRTKCCPGSRLPGSVLWDTEASCVNRIIKKTFQRIFPFNNKGIVIVLIISGHYVATISVNNVFLKRNLTRIFICEWHNNSIIRNWQQTNLITSQNIHKCSHKDLKLDLTPPPLSSSPPSPSTWTHI